MHHAPPIIITTDPPASARAGVLDAGAFWPPIDLEHLRQDIAIDASITPARLHHAAVEALAHTIDQLAPWAAKQQAQGHASLGDVPQMHINSTGVQVLRFERAVYASAKANLIERYADSDATGRAERGEAARQTQADEYRRDALAAVRDILGMPRMVSELI